MFGAGLILWSFLLTIVVFASLPDHVRIDKSIEAVVVFVSVGACFAILGGARTLVDRYQTWRLTPFERNYNDYAKIVFDAGCCADRANPTIPAKSSVHSKADHAIRHQWPIRAQTF